VKSLKGTGLREAVRELRHVEVDLMDTEDRLRKIKSKINDLMTSFTP
jgi:hypothetical protein